MEVSKVIKLLIVNIAIWRMLLAAKLSNFEVDFQILGEYADYYLLNVNDYSRRTKAYWKKSADQNCLYLTNIFVSVRRPKIESEICTINNRSHFRFCMLSKFNQFLVCM